jgi:predicted Zn-dependent peptidase
MLEHMAFKGTTRRTAKQIAEEMDMVGGHMNAYTSLENTVYYTRVLKHDMPLAVDILADILQHSTFDAEELERERQVILQEIAMHQDSPEDLIFDYFTETAYPHQPIGRSILGTTQQVSGYTRDNLIAYMQKHYHAHNMIITAAGNIDHHQFVQCVAEKFNQLNSKPLEAAPKSHYVGGDKRVNKKLEQTHCMIGFDAVSFHHKDYYAWQILSTLLGGGMSSRLFQEVREKRGLAYTVQSFMSSFSDSGMLNIYAATSEEKAGEMIKVICEEMIKLPRGIDALELQRAKNQMKANLLMSRESSASIAEWIGRHLLQYGRYKAAEEITTLIDNITPEDILRVSRDVLKNKHITLTTLGKQKDIPTYQELQATLG